MWVSAGVRIKAADLYCRQVRRVVEVVDATSPITAYCTLGANIL